MKLFFHCHKAAGTTVVHAAEASGMKLPERHRNGNPVGEDGARIKWTGLSDEETLEIIGGLEAAGVDLFCVEFDFPRWPLLDRIEGLECFTVLRDPAARAYSNFRVDLLDGKYDPETVSDFRSFMDGRDLFYSDNFYTRFFCRAGPKAVLSAEQIAFARKRLEGFAAVAVLERGALAQELAPLGFRPESFEWKNRILARPRHKAPEPELLAMGFDRYPDDPDYFAANAHDYALYSHFLHRPIVPKEPPGRDSQPVDTDRRTAILREVLEKSDVRRCVIVTGSFRAGTSFVCSLMGNNGLKGIRLERFSKYGEFKDEEAFRRRLEETFGTAEGGIFVAKMMWPHRNRLARSFGMERTEAARLAALFPDCKWIDIRRRDKIGQAISHWKAIATGKWQSRPGEVPAEPEYDFAEIRKMFVQMAAHDLLWEDFHAEARTDPYRITYEDFLTDVEGNLTDLLEHLADHRRPTTETRFASPLKVQRNEHSQEIRRRFLEDFYHTDF